MLAYWVSNAKLASGWRQNVRIECDAQGMIQSVTPQGSKAGAECFDGACMPAPSNVHSHAFQRAMAGLAELSNGGRDDFWSWRERMYAFLARLDPDDLQAIAAQAYVEMLKGGYGAVAEFHYIHRTPEGGWYEDKAACALAIAQGAATAGLDIVFAPCVYLTSGFDGAPLQPQQMRFEAGPDDIADIRVALERQGVRTALALHSLRAVPADRISEALAGTETGPVHIHVAEQIGEVEACISTTGRRPVERLFDLATVDARWCLIHATHMTPEETSMVCRSSAVAGLCPTTEGNLGDGFFDLPGLEAHSGAFGVGTDSHVSLDVAEELRWLDYGWRLRQQRRFAEGRAGHRGADLWMRAVAGGARALGETRSGLEPGARANFLILDRDHPSLAGRQGDEMIDSLIFCRHGVTPIKTVISKGAVVVREGRHAAEETVAEAYRRTMRKLVA
jgi:formimidoylglutamate deiminase